ncbi:glycosyltransferase family 2 protein [Devosia sp.]|uniref:glycosyltransferase family 2 protein n=1 Tax=Devosia sp. TaxID=1871048 RepID=UPI002FC96E6A
MKSVTVIVVNYFKAKRLRLAIESVFLQDFDGRINCIVIDNSNNDSERSAINDILRDFNFRTMFSTENIGYTRAVNLGIEAFESSDYFLLMSPDIVIGDKSVVSGLVRLMANNRDIGIISPVQVNDDGSIPEIGRQFPNPLKQIARRLWRQSDEVLITETLVRDKAPAILDVDWLQSSFSMIRKEVVAEIGGLNPQYFLFMADIEFCLEAWRRGFRVALTPISGVRADGIRASQGGILGVFSSRTMRIHVVDAFRYYLRNGWSAARPSIDRIKPAWQSAIAQPVSEDQAK